MVHAITSFNNPPADIQLTAYAKESLGLRAGNDFLSTLLFALEKDADIFFLYGVDCIWGAGRYRKYGGTIPVAVYLDTYVTSMNKGKRLSTSYYLKRLVWEKCIGMRSAAWVDAYIAVSPYIRDTYVHFGFPEHKFYIVPNFFEFGTDHTTQEVRPSPVTRLLYTGRLTHDKGIDLLITAVKDIPFDIPWHLRIVGDGPIKNECERMIQAFGLKGHIEIIPWVDPTKMDVVYECADVFIHPARWEEPFGRIFVEAMAHGIPVIAPRMGAGPWVLGNAGIFFENGNVEELRDAIASLVCDEALRERLGKAGVKRAQDFQRDRIGPHLERVLESVLSQASYPQNKSLF